MREYFRSQYLENGEGLSVGEDTAGKIDTLPIIERSARKQLHAAPITCCCYGKWKFSIYTCRLFFPPPRKKYQVSKVLFLTSESLRRPSS